MNVRALLTARVQAALDACGADGAPLVQTAGKPEFGDYQANGVMAAAKRARTNPRTLAERVVAALDLEGVADRVEIAGPGFLNISLGDTFLARLLASSALLDPVTPAQRVIVDYSSPNLAKEMHVGHLRSTVIGDACARVLEALGHHVVRQNHVGDWGTQFGMLLQFLDETGANSQRLDDLEAFYRDARARFDTDPAFADRCRARVVKLQSGDPATLERWRFFIDVSLSHCEAVYRRLGATLERSDVMAESAYNDDLDAVLQDLDARGLLTESDGAMCVFLDEFKGKDGAPLPLIVRKSDGGYLYSTTDLAAIRHRAGTLAADRALYFTDARQALHFAQVFAVARAAGFAPPGLHLEHMPFGTMLGTDGRPFRTRDGGVVKLNNLLDDAEQRAFSLVSEKNGSLDERERHAIARAVGIGAIKYADLSKNRTSDYVFDWAQMLSFEGNTAPYLQYAYARIMSLFRRGGIDPETVTVGPRPTVPPERDLAVALTRLQEVVEQVARDGLPHLLCAYLYELSTRFTRFYEQCPVLGSGDDEANRLAFAKRTAATLRLGLGLLGIATVERM